MFDTSSRKLTREVFNENGLSGIGQMELIREMEGYMRRRYLNDAHVKAGVPEYLEKLAHACIPMCVATGSPREFAHDGLERLGLVHYFKFITDGYEYGMDKHESAYFELMAEEAGCENRGDVRI